MTALMPVGSLEQGQRIPRASSALPPWLQMPYWAFLAIAAAGLSELRPSCKPEAAAHLLAVRAVLGVLLEAVQGLPPGHQGREV